MSRYQRLMAGLLLAGALFGAGMVLLHHGVYGFTLFLLWPALLGSLTTWVFRPTSGWQAAGFGALAAVVAAGSFLIVHIEGLICILMALPLVMPLGALGGWIAYMAARSRLRAPGIALLLMAPPAGITWDVNAHPPVFEVRTAIEIAASPEQVWKHVVASSELPEPHEWFFRAGVAYPQRAGIRGSGVGAVRYCDFSTGAFVEPVEVWDEPRLLRFRVTENPAPMREWTPYGDLQPRHLHGYLISKQGEFRLTPLANHRTLLEATSWYQHGLWPAEYWRWWSDAIIHQIHLRVLTHIRTLAEGKSPDE
jgi:hypothetical protein